jgi:hypothetical protein
MPLIKVAAELQRLLDLGCAGLRVYRVEAEVPHFTQEPNGSWLCKCVPIVTLQISIAEFAAPGSGYAGTTNVGLAMQRHSQTVVADGARSDAYKLFIPGASYAMWLPTNSPIARAPYQPNYVMVFSIFISADPVERYVINQDPARQAMLLEYLVAVIHDLDMGEINAIERICIPNKMWLQVEVRYNYMRRRRHPVFHAIAQDLLTRVSIDMMTTIAEEPYKIVMRQLGPNPAGDGENPECVLVPRA